MLCCPKKLEDTESKSNKSQIFHVLYQFWLFSKSPTAYLSWIQTYQCNVFVLSKELFANFYLCFVKNGLSLY